MPPPSALNNQERAKLPLGWSKSYSTGGGTGTRGELTSRTVQLWFRSGRPTGRSVTVQVPELSGLEFVFAKKWMIPSLSWYGGLSSPGAFGAQSPVEHPTETTNGRVPLR